MPGLCFFIYRLFQTLLVINFIHKFRLVPFLSFFYNSIIINSMKKERSSLYIWKQNLFFLEREHLMHAQMQAVRLPRLLLGIVRIWLILDRELSVRLPRLILTGLMHFALIFYALLFVPICTLITLPDIQILFLLHGCLNAIHHLRFLVQRDCVI